MENLTVRLALESDAIALSELNLEFNGIQREPLEIATCLKKNEELVVVAVLNDKVIGFGCAQVARSFCYKHLSGEITEMYVKPPYRRTGVASVLLHELEKLLLEKEVDAIRILTGVNNASAKIAYQKKGYRLRTTSLLFKIFGFERKHSTH